MHAGETDEKALREVRALAKEEGFSVPRELWDWYVRRFGPAWNQDSAAEDAWGEIRAALLDPPPIIPAAGPRKVYERNDKQITIAPPEHWIAYSQHFMREYRRLQLDALRALGRAPKPQRAHEYLDQTGTESLGFIPLNDLGDFLKDAARREAADGEADVLWYPASDDPTTAYSLDFRWGYSRAEMEQDYWSAMQRMNPLSAIKTMAYTIVSGIDVQESEAVGFLLSNQPIVLPWIEIRVAVKALTSATIMVGSPLVSPEAVRRAYVRARSLMSPDAVHLRGRRAWTYRMVAFVEDKRVEGLRWQDILAAWNTQAEAEYRYESLGGLQRSYYEARKGRDHGPARPERGFTL